MVKDLKSRLETDEENGFNPELDSLNRERLAALSEGDSVSYVNLCNGLGVSPEDPELYERGMAEILVDRKGLGSFVGKTPLGKKPGKTKDSPLDPKYMVLYEAAMEIQINPDNVFIDSDQKRRLLAEYMGYTKLVSGKKEKVSIWDARDTRVGEVFKSCFYRGRDVYIRKAR